MTPGDRLRRAAASLWLVAVLAARSSAGAPGGGAPAAGADLSELSLDQLMNIEVESVRGASRTAQRSLDAPSRVTVVTADDIRDHGYLTLAEALRSVAGLFVTNDRTYEYLGMRGFGRVDDYNSRVLVLVDGHRTNDDIFEGALIGTDFVLDMDQVERIEVIRGPASALYGANAVLGLVNVVTRPALRDRGLQASAGGGALGARSARLAYGGPLGASGAFQVSASGQATDGRSHLYFPEYDTPATHGGVADHLDSERNGHLFANATLGDFRLQGVFGARYRRVPIASWGSVFNDPRYDVNDARGWVDLGWQRTLANGTDVSGRLYADDYEYKARYPDDYSGDGSGPVTINRDWDIGRWAGAELTAHRTLFGRDELAVGGEWRRNARQDQRNWDEAPYVLYYDDRHQSTVWALFAEDALQLAPRLRFNAGLRHDHYSTFGGSTHPRAALLWSVRDRSVVKLVYGSAFRVPTSYEVYFWVNRGEANTGLGPETFRTGELALESYFGGHFHASASGYVLVGERFIRDEIRNNVDAFYNSGEVRGRGVEVELSGRWRDAELRVGAAHERLRFQPGDDRLANSPTDIVQASGKLPVVRRCAWLTADVRALSTRLNPVGEDVAGAVVTDANLVVRPAGRPWQVTLGVRNLLDTRWSDVAGPETAMRAVPQDGRTFRARLDVRAW